METIKVGNYLVGDKELETAIAHLPEQQKAYANNPEFLKSFEQNLKDMAALATYAEEIGLAETERFEESMATARRDILCQLGMIELMNTAVVTDDDAQEYYNEHQDNFVAPEHARAKHILVEEEKAAKDIKAKIESGEMTFEDAAKEYSKCPSSEKGGDLGAFAKGQMVPEFEEVCFKDEIGKLVGPVKTQFGYHLIVVTDRKGEGLLPIEEVKDVIKEQLLKARQEEAYQQKVAELREKYGY